MKYLTKLLCAEINLESGLKKAGISISGEAKFIGMGIDEALSPLTKPLTESLSPFGIKVGITVAWRPDSGNNYAGLFPCVCIRLIRECSDEEFESHQDKDERSPSCIDKWVRLDLKNPIAQAMITAQDPSKFFCEAYSNKATTEPTEASPAAD